MLADTDAGTGVRGHVRVWGYSAVQSHSMGGVSCALSLLCR